MVGNLAIKKANPTSAFLIQSPAPLYPKQIKRPIKCIAKPYTVMYVAQCFQTWFYFHFYIGPVLIPSVTKGLLGDLLNGPHLEEGPKGVTFRARSLQSSVDTIGKQH